MSLTESQEFFYDLCAKPDVIRHFKKNRVQVLKRYFRQAQDRQFLAGYAAERFETYRQHISIGILGNIGAAFPVIRSLVSTKEWNDLLNDFYLKRMTRSPLARHVFSEFAGYLKKRYRGPLLRRFPYLRELAEYENLEIKLLFEKDPSVTRRSPGTREVYLLNPHLALRVYSWPVHLICREFSSPKKMTKGRYPLIVYRDPQTLKIRFMESNVLVAHLIEKVRRGRGRLTTHQILTALLRQEKIPSESQQAFLREGKMVFKFLKESGIFV